MIHFWSIRCSGGQLCDLNERRPAVCACVCVCARARTPVSCMCIAAEKELKTIAGLIYMEQSLNDEDCFS